MATFTVTNADDSGAGSLRQAVLDADETARADTIVFGAGFDGGVEDVIRLTGGQIRIREALTIDGGDDVTITGDAAGDDVTDADGITDVEASGARRLDDNSRIFDASDDVTLDGLTLTGGGTTARDADGGAVRAAGGLILINSTVSGNSSNGAGGGIFGDGAYGYEVTVENSTVSRNSSTIAGGGIGVGEEGSITVRNSTISGNRTLGSGGGLSGNSDTTDFAYASITVRNSTIRDNSSTGGGGGIAVGEVSNVTVRNSTVSGNSTLRSGGGILTDGLLLKNSTISGNSAGGVYSVGGGIAGDDFILRNSTVSGNSAVEGGGIFYFGEGYSGLGLKNSIVLGNAATVAGSHEINDGEYLVLGGGNIVGRDVFSGMSDIGDTSLRQVFDRTVTIGDGVLAGRLADNGGPTRTIALNPDVSNPALGGANPGKAPRSDQRGELRDAAPDLGAFEARPVDGVVLVGGRMPDALTGASLADQLYGRGGDDELRGRAGGDQLRGEAGRDWLAGGKGDDGLDGGTSRDKLVGKRGDDRLFGGDGDDSLRGGPGDDLMSGGRGADAFVFAPDFGRDRVAKFDANPAGVQDLIDLRAFEISARRFPERVFVEDLGRHTRIMVDDEGVILLRGVSGEGADTIDEADFLL